MIASEIAVIIKERVTAHSVAEKLGLNPNRAGFVCCPFHHEKTPSCKVRNNERGFVCFGCGEKGSVIDFVQRFLGIGFVEACEWIDSAFCLGIGIGKPATMREKKAALRRKKELQEQREKETESEDAYYTAFEYWKLCRDSVEDNQPYNADDDWNDDFCNGLYRLAIARFNLEEAQWAMSKAL